MERLHSGDPETRGGGIERGTGWGGGGEEEMLGERRPTWIQGMQFICLSEKNNMYSGTSL